MGTIAEIAINLLPTLIIGAIAFFLKREITNIDIKIKSLDVTDKELHEKIDKLEKDLPYKYTMRDDFIRATTNIDQKLDRISDKIDKIAGGAGNG